MANPTLLTSPIAENGDKNVIPATTGATTGLLDQEHGFQQINELPLQAGGLPPQRKDFNGIFNLLSGILYMAQRGYTFEYDNTFPYVVGCIVIDPLDGKTYRCINDVPAGGSNPSTDVTNWVHYDCLPLEGGGALAGASLTWNGDDLGNSAIVARLLGTTGYIARADGLKLQWGEDGSVTSTIHDITFPISFTGQPIVIPAVTTTDSSFITLMLRSATATGARIDGSLAFKWVSWFAIGY